MCFCLQVRFGVLNAGNFGVSQSRKRTFIWGVAPDNILPDWPKPQHVFRSSQLTINLPGNVQVSMHEITSQPCSPYQLHVLHKQHRCMILFSQLACCTTALTRHQTVYGTPLWL